MPIDVAMEGPEVKSGMERLRHGMSGIGSFGFVDISWVTDEDLKKKAVMNKGRAISRNSQPLMCARNNLKYKSYQMVDLSSS